MKPAALRSWLLVFCALVALCAFATVLDVTGAGGAPSWYGLWGAQFAADAAAPYQLAVLDIDPGSASDVAGLRAGDRVDVRANTLVQRFGMLWQPMSGTPIPLLVRRGGAQLHLVVTPRPVGTRRWDIWLGDIGALWIVLFAMLIVYRRAFVPGNMLLASVLAVFALGEISPTTVAAPFAWMYVATGISGFVIGPIVIALWAAYAGTFGRPLSRGRRAVTWLCYALVTISVGIGAAQVAGAATLVVDPVALFYSPAWDVPYAAAVVSALACSVLAILASRGVDRQRAIWTLAPLGGFLGLEILTSFAQDLLPSYAITQYGFAFALNVFTFVVPVVLTYAALNRRLMDIGFVLNRAAVFAIVSTIVIGTFVAIEWAASTWLADATHATSGIVGLAVALALGLSLRYIHKYADRFVDRVFFHKRHEDEAALRRFAHEAAYITDRSILLQRACEEVLDHTGADRATILLLDESGKYGTVSENDPGIVALRAWHRPIDLHEHQNSALRGDFAFPMVSRGALIGALVCGEKRDGEGYAPDESEALLALAHGVASALDTLALRQEAARQSVAEELAALRTLIEQRLHAV
jgi:hypothetical protein